MTTLAKECYERFQQQTRSNGYLPPEELPPLHCDAWEDIVKLVLSRAAALVRDVGESAGPRPIGEEVGVRDMMLATAKAVEALR